MREIIATGKTVEEAIEKGCLELGKERDQVSVEILEMQVKKLFKTIPAKVRITADEPEVEPVKEVAAPAPASSAPKAQEAPKQQKPSTKPSAAVNDEPEIEINLSESRPATLAVNYLTEIFTAMGSTTVKVTAFSQGEATLLRVEGEDIRDIVETRGETVQALSYLTDRSVNRGIDKKDPEYIRVRLDVAGYRGRREGELIALAKRTAKEVIENNRSRTLAPMNPYERLIIHTTIGEIEGVASESVGSDTERRVVVKSTAPGARDGDDWKKPRGKGGREQSRGRQGSNRSGGGSRNNAGRGKPGDRDKSYSQPRSNTPEREYADKPRDTSAAPIVPDQREAIKDANDLPLYGKIEL